MLARMERDRDLKTLGTQGLRVQSYNCSSFFSNYLPATKTLVLLGYSSLNFLDGGSFPKFLICSLLFRCVLNFDFPRNIEDYVHRIGRTGRAG